MQESIKGFHVVLTTTTRECHRIFAHQAQLKRTHDWFIAMPADSLEAPWEENCFMAYLSCNGRCKTEIYLSATNNMIPPSTLSHLRMSPFSLRPSFQILIPVPPSAERHVRFKATKLSSLTQHLKMRCNRSCAAYHLTEDPAPLPLSGFASSHHMAKVSQHSIPYWAKRRHSLCSPSFRIGGIASLLLPS